MSTAEKQVRESMADSMSPEEKALPLTNLLEKLHTRTKTPITKEDMKGMGFANKSHFTKWYKKALFGVLDMML